MALSSGDAITRDDLGLPDDPFIEGANAEIEALIAQAVAAPSAAPTAAALPSDLVAYLDDVERDILARALERHRFNRTATGASLGLSLRQMRYRMARLGVTAADPWGSERSHNDGVDEPA